VRIHLDNYGHEVRALDADRVSQREIAARLGMNRRTVKRLVEAAEPPRYRRQPSGSMLDPLDAVLRKLVADFEDIKAPRVTELLRDDYGYTGSVDLVRRRLAELRPKTERPAQKTGYRPGQVMQVDWAEMPTRPKLLGRERRVYALICTLPFSGASTAHFTFDMTIESFLQGHVRAFDWLGGVPRECVYLSGAPTFAGFQPTGTAALLVPSSAAGACGTITNEFTGTVAPSACSGAGGLTYIGASVGQVATAIGPRS
jgi:transposase